jgi:branched-chain amino acid transport system substrate-binding protein
MQFCQEEVNMFKKATLLVLVLVLAIPALTSCGPTGADTIKIGLDVPMTGDIAYVGTQSQRAAEMKVADITEAGGLQVGDKKYTVEIIIEDNESKAESATAAATKRIRCSRSSARRPASRPCPPARWPTRTRPR